MKRLGWYLICLGLVACRAPADAQLPAPTSVMDALDADRDGTLSVEEIRNAPTTLARLDADRDGVLRQGELGPAGGGGFAGRVGPGGNPPGAPPRGRGPGGPPPGAAPGQPPGFPGMPPGLGTPMVIAALDSDGDGSVSAAEVRDSNMSLLALDADNSGTLGADELMSTGGGFGRGGPGGPGGRGGGGGRGGFGGGGVSSGTGLEPADVASEDGAATLPDLATFHRLSYQGAEVLIDTQLTGLEFVKFVIAGANTAAPKLYFMNTKKYRGHPMFMQAVGLSGAPGGGNGQMRGVLVYRPLLGSPSGQPGLFTFEFEPNDAYPFDLIRLAHDQLVAHAPILKGKLAYHPLPAALRQTEQDRASYQAANLPVFLDEDLFTDVAFLPLNEAESFGILRLMELDERPGVRDVVLYRGLPNEMPRVAGVITSFRQTPLSHVNLRAVQDRVPNAFIKGAAENTRIAGLVGKYVYYRVAADGYEIREATLAEVDAHFAELRPPQPYVPVRDLTVTKIRPLSQVGFTDASNVGVKAANVAALRTMGFDEGVVPDGFAIAFSFYDEFMRFNGFYEKAEAMRRAPDFQNDTDARERALKDFRGDIEDGRIPDAMRDALTALQGSFAPGVPIRMRSSTNNEDLPGFSGAGLYDSFTHNPDEGHIAKSVQQVFASLWNFRAYEEREFYRIDHFAAAMGILVHPNYSDEQANGVAVSDDIVYQTRALGAPGRIYYINVQLGEDLVTNPDAESVPEELLLNSVSRDYDRYVRGSNQVAPGETLLSAEHRSQMRTYMNIVHNRFRELYGIEAGQPFAMEIEFKVTTAGVLAIKQARPWVY